MDVGDAAVGGPGLLAVDDPLVRRPRRTWRVVRTPETSEPAFGSEAQKAATLMSSAVPKQRGIHSPICSPRALAEDRRDGERGAHDRHADAGVAPEQLLVDDRQRQAGRVGEELRQAFEAVEADLRGLLDDRPRRLLALVPLVRGGAHDVRGEAVDPVADVLLVLGQLQREASPPGRPRRRSPRRRPRRRRSRWSDGGGGAASGGVSLWLASVAWIARLATGRRLELDQLTLVPAADDRSTVAWPWSQIVASAWPPRVTRRASPIARRKDRNPDLVYSLLCLRSRSPCRFFPMFLR